jgi:branched-chain amino acid transport system permease protein
MAESRDTPVAAADLAETASRPAMRWFVASLVLVAVVASLPFWSFINTYLLSVVVRALLFIAFGQAWNVTAGIGGQLSLGHGVFLGIGAYCTAMLFNWWNIPPWIGVWVGICVGLVAALAMGGATFRLRGVYFALATIVVSLGFEELAHYYVALTGGDAGLAVRFVGDSTWAMQSRSPTPFLWLMLAVVVAYYAATRWLLRSRFGFELQAVRDDQDAAAAVGVDVIRTKYKGFLLSAAMTTFVGAIYVQFYMAIDPDTAFGLTEGIQIQLPALIGGLGSAGGAVIGGAVMILMSELTNWAGTGIGQEGVDVLAYGVVLLVIVMRAPDGIIGRVLNLGASEGKA